MTSEQQPRILVCTVNAWNAKVGDNTFPLLLQGYPKGNIAHLFIREEQPDSPICERYFRISESRVIRSIFRRSEKTGDVVEPGALLPEVEKAAHYANKACFYYTKLFCREAVWLAGKWKTPELEAFIDDFAPDVVLYEMSRYIHLNNIVRYILCRTRAAGIGCFWDDTFTYKQEKSFGYKALRYFQRRNLKKLAQKTSAFFAITPKTKREADALFGIQSTVLTKPILQMVDEVESAYTVPLKMLYTGNVGIGRLEVLKLLVRELAQINADGVRIRLDVYTNTPVTEADGLQFHTAFSAIHPPVPQTGALALQKNADILLFVESLKGENKIARLSFSTKITDYYAAGKCIFAVGNSDLAPMELFAETDSAITAVSEEELHQKLRLLTDADILAAYAKKAFRAGQEHHARCDVQRTFFAGIEAAVRKRGAKKWLADTMQVDCYV